MQWPVAPELWFLQLVNKIAPLKARKTKMSQLISMEMAYCLFAYCKNQEEADNYHLFLWFYPEWLYCHRPQIEAQPYDQPYNTTWSPVWFVLYECLVFTVQWWCMVVVWWCGVYTITTNINII